MISCDFLGNWRKIPSLFRPLYETCTLPVHSIRSLPAIWTSRIGPMPLYHMACAGQILRPSKDFMKDDDKIQGILNREVTHVMTSHPLRMPHRGREGVYIDVYAMHTEGGGGQTFPKFCVCNS